MRTRRATLIGAVSLVLLIGAGCTTQPGTQVVVMPEQPSQIQVTPEMALGNGLDLRLVGELLKTSPTAQAFEQKLNEQGGVNNLDLNGDGNVEYIKVQEYGTPDTGERGFSLTCEVSPGQIQEIADIKIVRDPTGMANVQLAGNGMLYGPSAYYHSQWNTSDAMLLGYLYGSLWRPYVSPYAYGYYPPYWRTYRPMPVVAYRETVTKRVTTTTVRKVERPVVQSTMRSPNQGRIADTVRKQSITMPTQSQRSFETRDTNRSVSTGGFGSSRSTTSSPSSAPRPSVTAPTQSQRSFETRDTSKPVATGGFGSSRSMQPSPSRSGFGSGSTSRPSSSFSSSSPSRSNFGSSSSRPSTSSSSSSGRRR